MEQEASYLLAVPLLAILGFAAIFIVIPMFAKISEAGIDGENPTEGLVEMSEYLADFTPIYGIGLAIGMLVLFFAMATFFSKGEHDYRESMTPEPYTPPPTHCNYCGKVLSQADIADERCHYCGAPMRDKKLWVDGEGIHIGRE